MRLGSRLDASDGAPEPWADRSPRGAPAAATVSRCGRYCGDFPVPRVAIASAEEFRRDYASIGRPVVITNLLRHTAAYSQWTPEYLIRTVGDRRIPLTKLRNRVLRSNNAVYQVPFADYAARAFGGDAEADRYCAQQIELPASLAGDLPTPDLVGSWLRVSPRLWLSTPGQVTDTHRDGNHNLLAQVVGRKRVTLISPVFSHALYPHHPRSRLARYSRVDLSRPDLSRFPAARDLVTVEVTLTAGETLFLPVYWWHRVETLDVSVSVNFWWAPPLNLSLHTHPQVGGTPEDLFRAVHALADLGDFSSEFDVAEYLWAEGYEVFAAAYLDHCLSILVAETRAHENGEMDEDRRAIRSVRGCCRRAVEILAGRRGRSRRHGIGAFSPVVARARRLVEKYECAELFRPSRWVPSQPAGDLMSSAPASRSTRTRTARDRGVQPFAPRRLIMNPESDRMRIVPTNASGETPDKAPKKRFRIEKIEERIAPGGHYNPQSKWVGGSTPSGADSSASGSISIVSGTSY